MLAAFMFPQPFLDPELMPGPTSLTGFVIAALVVLLIPGPAVFYVVTRSLAQGHRAGLVSVLGLSTGALVHVAAATLGLSAILVASATTFGIVKLLGAGYLIYLGVRSIRSRSSGAVERNTTPRSHRRIFADGIVVSVLNPKIAIFFLAFLPQFVDPARGPIPRQMFFLGALYIAMAFVTDSTYALLAGHVGRWLGSRAMQGPIPRYASGAVYVGLGVGVALADRR